MPSSDANQGPSWTRVAVTLRRSDAQSYDEPRDALARDWTRFFESTGICPILIPSSASDPVGWARELGAQGLLLTGGESLGADVARDRTESQLLTWALEHSIPTVGVCRGLHTIHSYLGGQLEPVTSTEAHVACEHALELENDLAVAVGSGAGLPARPVVNSFHRQRVSGTLPELRVTGMTPDGTVELVDHASGPLRAAQFHPERDGCDPSLTRWLFEPLLTV